MRPISDREKRTIRIAAILLTVYLACFFGLRAWKSMEMRRTQYRDQLAQAQRLKRDLRPYENRVLMTEKLREAFKIDVNKLSRATLVSDVSSAIQKAAAAGKVPLGHVRELGARTSGRDLASVQFEGSGPVPAVMSLLQRLETIGYPLVVDAVQINSEPTKPGMVKVSLTIVILDYEQWKKEGNPNA
jgi:hypothetical protein